MRRYMGLVLLVAAVIGQAARADAPEAFPTDEAQFTAYVAAAFSKSFDGATVTVDSPHTVVVELPALRAAPVTATSTMHYDTTKLRNACIQEPTTCQALITKFLNDAYAEVRFFTNAVEVVLYRRPELDTTKILATGIDDWTVKNVVERGNGYSRRIAVKLFDNLWIGCMSNTPAAPPYLVQKDLDRLDMSAEAAVALCVKNTVATVPPFAQSLRGVAPGEVGVLSGAGESMLILAHDQWGIVANRFAGDLIVSIPDENTMLYSRGSWPLAVQAVIDRAKSIRGQRAPIIEPTVYRWTQSGWDIVYPAKS